MFLLSSSTFLEAFKRSQYFSQFSDDRKKSEELKLENENVRKDYASMIFNSYKSRLKESKIMFLLSSSTFLEAFKRSQYFSQFSDDRKKYSNKILKNLTSLDSINKILKDKIVAKEDLIKSNNIEKRDLSSERNNKNKALSSLKTKENAYKRQINQKQRQADLLDKEIDRLIKEAIRLSNENKKSSTFSLTPEAKALAESFSKNKGNLKMYNYVPENLPESTRVPLVFVLHGCTQSAEQIASETGWNKLADSLHFIVVYPEQRMINNVGKCFNFFFCSWNIFIVF